MIERDIQMMEVDEQAEFLRQQFNVVVADVEAFERKTLTYEPVAPITRSRAVNNAG